MISPNLCLTGVSFQAAVIRIGLMEMVKYVREFGGDSPVLATFFESCGVADLVRSFSLYP